MRNILIIGILAGLLISGAKAESPENVTEDTASPKAQTAPATPEAQPAPVTPPPPLFKSRGETATIHPRANAARNAYFGDLHVHTTYSFDAFIFGTLATPYDAYRYAKGETIKHPAAFDVKLREPLDFYAVTDHAMFLGMVPAAADITTALSKLEIYSA